MCIMIVFCSNPKCNTAYESSEPKCPKCGSTDRSIEIPDSFTAYESLIGIIDKNLYSGDKKFFSELTVKPDFDRDTQQDVMVTRKYNRQEEYIASDGSYIEEIRDKDGNLIKEPVIGKLNEHKGHGCDRKNRKQPVDGGDADA